MMQAAIALEAEVALVDIGTKPNTRSDPWLIRSQSEKLVPLQCLIRSSHWVAATVDHPTKTAAAEVLEVEEAQTLVKKEQGPKEMMEGTPKTEALIMAVAEAGPVVSEILEVILEVAVTASRTSYQEHQLPMLVAVAAEETLDQLLAVLAVAVPEQVEQLLE